MAAVSYADDHGGDVVYGWLMAGLGLGALLGGVVYGARQWGGEPARRLRTLLAFLAVCYLPLMLMPGVVAMTVLAVLAFSWLVTTFTVGASVGTGGAGPVVEAGGALWGFAVPGAAGAVSLLVLVATGRVLAAPGRGAVVAASSENDPNRAVEPRFSSGDRA